MSRVGKAPIKLPSGVELNVQGSTVNIKGPKGNLESPLPEGISLAVDSGVATLTRSDESKKQRERHGLARALLQNCVTGVSDGWTRNLELVGVGYRAQLKGKELVLSLGYSHEIKYPLPAGIEAQVTDQTRVQLTGIDRQKLGQVASEIRSFRPPEPYKGKGVRYAGEQIRRKAGKAGKAGKK
ncbi:MAG: 50S ribosomal protein L6 [Leptospiraceae bacterium]|nr:50S ribosomal protein L6 [Leptospiraceae bacterium]MCB1302925.1 50S ribosomal protein L6 [Leptospiraceae bacterium]